MESATFKFDAARRRTLAACFRLLPDDLVQSFLDRCEYAITGWRAEWPMGRWIGNKNSNARLRALGAAILNARCEIEKLPDAASHALWVRWQCPLGDVTIAATTNTRAAKQAYILQLLKLGQMATELAGDMSHAGGAVKYCERDLVDRLVQAFIDSSFNRKPSAAPEGMFMLFLGELAEMLTLPNSAALTLGKDLVAASIKWHLKRESQFQEWEAAMYEFPPNKQSS